MNWHDWFKHKLTPAQVKERQTDAPRAAPLHREFAGHPSKGLTPARLAGILLAAEEGDMIAQAELYMDMREKDTHIDAEMHKREMAVKKLDWKLEPPRNASAQEIANTQLLADLIRDELDVGALRMAALDAIGHGYACIELGWGRNAQGLWFPNRIEHRPPSWFTCPPDQRNTLHLRDTGSSHGVPLQPFGWIVHQHKSRAGYIARTGLYRSLVWPYLFKNYSLRDLAEFLEIYGLPIRIGKYPATASANEKTDLLRTVLSIGHHAAGIIPDSMQLELQSVLASGNADSFKVMIDWCEACQSKGILGGTLTSSTGANGNRALGEVHNEVRLDIRDDDAMQLDQTLSSHLVYPMAMLNGLFADNRCPSWVSDTQEPDDLNLYADALPKLASAGARIPARWVNLKLKIPEPEGNEPVLQVQRPEPMPYAAGTRLIAAAKQAEAIEVTGTDAQAEQLSREAAPAGKIMLDAIRAKVDGATSLEQLRDDLLHSYGDIDDSDLVSVMTMAFAAAELSGQFDVSEGE